MINSKIILFLVALLAIFGCKKEETNSGGSGNPGNPNDVTFKMEVAGHLMDFSTPGITNLTRATSNCPTSTVVEDFVGTLGYATSGESTLVTISLDSDDPLASCTNIPREDCGTGNYGYVLVTYHDQVNNYLNINPNDEKSFDLIMKSYSANKIEYTFSGWMYNYGGVGGVDSLYVSNGHVIAPKSSIVDNR